MLSGAPRIDSHHHFWDPSRAEYPFLTAELAAIRRPFGPDDLRSEIQAEGIAGTVLVQTRSSTAPRRRNARTSSVVLSLRACSPGSLSG